MARASGLKERCWYSSALPEVVLDAHRMPWVLMIRLPKPDGSDDSCRWVYINRGNADEMALDPYELEETHGPCRPFHEIEGGLKHD